MIEFPSFAVPPGTRRGVVPDQAAEAFAGAMARLRPLVEEELRRFERERRATANRQVVEDLRRALRGLRTRLPQYDLPPALGIGAFAHRDRTARQPLPSRQRRRRDDPEPWLGSSARVGRRGAKVRSHIGRSGHGNRTSWGRVHGPADHRRRRGIHRRTPRL